MILIRIKLPTISPALDGLPEATKLASGKKQG
jgi:hypothetical protein